MFNHDANFEKENDNNTWSVILEQRAVYPNKIKATILG